ncbi:DPP IV N-terminal domain-containing protein [Flammeovirga yaeyamensis]|uniref:DPP IV N-terminal domain-containing protein n=1 Tax=Flammeovirga yaeyamensis TaxID=367791 RepID=A0AAX1N2C3_9BACT|nr:S9 family peptidase [Flammeovirga yaeyamensis]MBB3701193.1 dipeptidyl-peptidase-4 [Flammeovirga yaeyamensis]NMF38481.1 S9 family peptidase [Flammeovirga yaeyamensis]QWG01659.1 DPP IV N-terminal domain-containing protein [Flammeovirga yaeyamensis]
MKKTTLLIGFLMSLFCLSAFAQTKNITLENIWSEYKFYPRSVSSVRWMNDGGFYSSLEKNQIVKNNVATGEAVETILNGNDLNIAIAGYSFSADESQMLLMTDREAIYRRSFKAEYYIYDFSSKKLSKLSDNGKQSYATLSPDGKKVAFVRENNLFVVELADMKETQLTKDGKFNHIINGSADWVYEEEFSMAKAFTWSPDSKKIAYQTFDETEVPEYNMQYWGQLYPQDYRFKYPKAGEKNSIVSVSVVDLTSGKHQKMDIGKETDIYIPRIQWTQDSGILSMIRMNRLQNKLEILHASALTGSSEVVLSEESKTYVDLDYNDDLTYLKDGKHFIYTSEQSGYKHIYLYDINGKLVRQITNGEWEVTSLVGINENVKKPVIYYISNEENDLDRDFYSIDLYGKKKVKLSTKAGQTRVNMSHDFSYYIAVHSSANEVSTTSLFKTKKNELVKVLVDNAQFKGTIEEYGFVNKELFTFKTEDDVELYGYMLKPADFDADKKYPVLMFQYSGPGSNQVANSWGGSNYAWHQMLTQKGYIVAVVDPRGTGSRGRDFKHVTYKQLGKYEAIDQIATAKWLGEQNYVDASRIGIWGWSFGGYMSSLCLFTGADHFKMAIAVAPVTNWRYYDTIYTERFQALPQNNASGYDDNSPIHHVDKLKGKFFLIHGTGDDNVHVQNSFDLSTALIKANKQFREFYYPNKNHGIYGGNTRLHLYTQMTEFVENNL